jgi:uncharacterized membrane protein YeiH
MLLGLAGVPENLGLWCGILLIVTIRLIAVRWDLRLPA